MMDIIDAIDVQKWITLIHDCIVSKYMFSFILLNIKRRDLITICFGPR